MGKENEIVKKRVSLSIDSDVLDLAKAKAKQEDRSLSNFVQNLLKKYLKKS